MVFTVWMMLLVGFGGAMCADVIYRMNKYER